MFTPAKLREIAAEAEARYDELASVEFSKTEILNGLDDDNRRQCVEIRRIIDQAKFCARYMEAHNLTEVHNIGPFGNLKVKNGDRVRILKGAPLMTMGATPAQRAHWDAHGCHRFAKRTYEVTVSQVYDGWCSGHDFEYVSPKYWRENLRNQTIEWAGTGGYWTWTSPEFVEVI